MPGGSGIRVLESMERRTRKTPVVLITGAADAALINKAMDHGPITLIRKPVRVKQVREVLEVLGVRSQRAGSQR